jgi:UDP-glucuronate 4-epimerase
MTKVSLAGRRILVTGAAGFVGYHVAQRLLDHGVQVTGLDNLNAYYDVSLKEARLRNLSGRNGFSFHKIDLADAGAVMGLFESVKPQAVINLAAQAGVRYSIDHPHDYVSANLAGFLSILEACRHHPVGHLIYASSSSVYGANAKVPFSETDGVGHPVSLYAASKRSNELMAHTYAHLFQVPTSGLRFFTVYGPFGRPDMAYFKFTKAISEGKAIDVYNEGRMKRDFTYIDDVVEAIVRLVDAPPAADADWDPEVAHPDPSRGAAPYRVYNIGNHTPVTLERFIAAIETALGRKAQRRLLPMQPGDVPQTYADVAALQAAVGFSPDTTIEEGISRFVAWYRDYYGVAD